MERHYLGNYTSNFWKFRKEWIGKIPEKFLKKDSWETLSKEIYR